MDADLSPNERLLALTHQMLKQATAGDWDQLTKLEQIRLPLFHEVFEQGIANNVELAREVLEMDEKTKELAQAQMPILQQEILRMQSSGKANNAYQAIQDSTYDEE